MTDDDYAVRKCKIPAFLALGKTKVQELIDSEEIEVFDLTPGGRAQAAMASNLKAYLQRRREASRQRREEAKKAKAEAQPPKPQIKRRHLKKRRGNELVSK
jgi:hypothetical protein